MKKYGSIIIATFLVMSCFFIILISSSSANADDTGVNSSGNTSEQVVSNNNQESTNVQNTNTSNSNNNQPSQSNNSNHGYWSRWSKRGYVDLRPKMTYVSQLKPVYIPDGCEAASLKMALSIKGKAKHISLPRMIRRIGWRHHGNPNYEYSNNPYRAHSGATIFPRELVKVARWYGANGRIANYSSKRKLIRALQHLDPIVIEAGHKMRMSSDHIVCLIGYRHALRSKLDQFEYADPESYKPLIRWTNANWVMKVYDRPYKTGERAAIIL